MKRPVFICISIISLFCLACSQRRESFRGPLINFENCADHKPEPENGISVCSFQAKDFLYYLQKEYQRRANLPFYYNPGYVVSYWGTSSSWVREDDIPYLISVIHSKEPCCLLWSGALSFPTPNGPSSVGQEAAFIISGFRAGTFAPMVGDKVRDIDTREIEKWWQQHRTQAP